MLRILSLVLISATSICFLAMPVAAEVHVGGTLDSGGRWDEKHSPYVVDRTLLIPRRARLFIGPGTTILISPGIAASKTLADSECEGGIAIVVNGTLACVGTGERRIRFVPSSIGEGHIGWHGIEFRGAAGANEIAYTDITGAQDGITVSECSPLIRAAVVERNNIGVNCRRLGSVLLKNCVLTGNFVAAIRVSCANPVIENCLIENNPGSGLWGDGASVVACSYNCISGNGDGNYLDCDPLLGRLAALNTNGDSVDRAGNLAGDPAFAGTTADSLARERYLARSKTAKAGNWEKVKRQLSEFADLVIHGSMKRPIPAKEGTGRFSLSPYSPCRNAGNPAPEFNNTDGSRNDMGIYGGPGK
jgi:hypothetical protein